MNKRRRRFFFGSLLFLCSAWPAVGQTEPSKLAAAEIKCSDLPGSGQTRGLRYVLYEGALRRLFVIHTVTPEYPLEAEQAGVQGQVKLHVMFDREGRFWKARVSESPHRLLSEAVLEAVKGWRIKKPNLRGGSGLTLGELRFVFTLKDGRAEVTDAPEEEQRKLMEGLEEKVCRSFSHRRIDKSRLITAVKI